MRDARASGVLLCLSLLSLSTSATATLIDVVIDTSALAGQPAQLALDLIDGDTITNTRLYVVSFETDGVLGAHSAEGGVAGSLPDAVTLEDTDFFNEYLQSITLGDRISFSIDPSESCCFSGVGIPDGLSVLLLDVPGTASLVSTGLPGDALAIFSFFDPDYFGFVQVGDFGVGDPPVTVTVTERPVPEPSVGVLVALGIGSLAFRRRFDRQMAEVLRNA